MAVPKKVSRSSKDKNTPGCQPSSTRTPAHGDQERSGNSSASLPGSGPSSLPVIGLGGSAGGLAALRTFFSQMPADSGLAFVVVMHLSPKHESNLAAILQNVTTMSVVQVHGIMPVAANQVYVIPPGKQLSISNGSLHLSELKRQYGKHEVVDLFFRSLADSQGTHAVAVVLSGVFGCEQMLNGRLRLSIKDSGPGISPEEIARLFVPFERLGQEYGEVEGAGLGLLVSRRLAEAMGGCVGGESQLGVGSTFWVELPLATPIALVQTASIGSAVASAVEAKQSRLRRCSTSKITLPTCRSSRPSLSVCVRIGVFSRPAMG